MEDYTGRKIGKYVLESRLGAGGMATVYRSTHPQLNRPVAIKMLPFQEQSDENFRERFIREAQAMATLNHPTLIRIYDIDQEQNLFYMVMDLVQGGSLDDRLRSGTPMGLYWACDVVARVAEALDIAHRKGIIHRDIKPSNILLTTEDDPVIADFGIAKMLQHDTAELTSVGTIMGTPLYMAPEQIRGDHVDGRADLYALGIVLYQLLTGRTPFSGDTLTVITKQLHEAPPPLRISTPDLPAPLEAVVLRALNKNPEQRFVSGKDFANAIREALRSVNTAEMVRTAPVAQQAAYVMPTMQQAAQGFMPTQAMPAPTASSNDQMIKLVIGGIFALVLLVIVFQIIKALFVPLLLIALGVGGWYWYQQQQKQKMGAPPPPQTMMPPSTQTVSALQQGVGLYRSGQYPQALAAFDIALTQNSNNIDGLISRGLLFYTLGDLPKALTDFNSALQINPRHVRALYQRALVYGALDQNDAAKDDLQHLLSFLPPQADLRREADARLQSLNAMPEPPKTPSTGKLSDEADQTVVAQSPVADATSAMPSRIAPATTKLSEDDLPDPDATFVSSDLPDPDATFVSSDLPDPDATFVGNPPPHDEEATFVGKLPPDDADATMVGKLP